MFWFQFFETWISRCGDGIRMIREKKGHMPCTAPSEMSEVNFVCILVSCFDAVEGLSEGNFEAGKTC